MTQLDLLSPPKRKRAPITYREKRPTHCAALRKLLSDFEWHGLHEIMAVGGTRAPARLFDIARGIDGGPSQKYEVRYDAEDRTRTAYRFVPEVRR